MVATSKQQHIPRNRLLYDPDTLAALFDDHGSPTEIKMAVKTSATQYEIRTALRYWNGGSQTHRTADRIWSHCEAIDNGEWVLTANDEIKYGETA